jgi:hypothetical protein
MKVITPVVAGLTVTMIFAAGLVPQGGSTAPVAASEPSVEFVYAASASRVTPELPQEQVQDLTF